MKVALAQTKPVTGDLVGNTEQIVRNIRWAKEDNADIVVFPETAITGYCCGALFEQESFVQYNISMLEEIIAKEVPDDMVAIVGFVDQLGKKVNGDLRIANSAAVIQGGKVIDTYDKVLLANGEHHEDRKYFTSGEVTKVIPVQINGETINLGVSICEDAWHQNHERDIIQELKDLGADLIVSPNQSYFHYDKQEIRRDLFGGHAANKGIPVVMTNGVGVGDIVKNILIYDGGSFAFDSEGNPLVELERFQSDYCVVDVPLTGKGSAAKLPSFTKYQEIYDALVFEQKEIFDVIGIPNAQVHVSGGIDSAIVATIVYDAMGADHTVLITNPTEDNGDITKGFAQYLADKLSVKLHWNSTQEPYQSVVESHKNAFGKEPSLVGKACIQAVLRTVQGIGAYHHFKSGIVATGNHTEIVEGWATFHDIGSIGVHALIGDLTKVELYQFADYINERFGDEVIPQPLFDGTIKPMAELADAKEDPIDYWVRSGIDAELIRNRKGPLEIIADFQQGTLTQDFFPLDFEGKSVYEKYSAQQFSNETWEAFDNSRRSVFKSAQGAPIVIISPRSRGFSNRETIINHYLGGYDINDVYSHIKRRIEVLP